MRALAIVALLAGVAHADDPARVDWARGLVIADGLGIADRHAPNPAVARGTSRRGAEEAAKTAITAVLARLPLADGGKVGDMLTDKQVKARIERAVDAALTLDAEPETDGAWRVTLAVPIEAIRQALTGDRALPASGDPGPSVVVVDGASAKPSVGWKVAGRPAATLWVKEIPTWAKDAPHVKAKAARHGELEIDGTAGSDATLYLIAQ